MKERDGAAGWDDPILELFRRIFVFADGEQDVTAFDKLLAVVPSGISGNLHHLSHEVLQHRGQPLLLFARSVGLLHDPLGRHG